MPALVESRSEELEGLHARIAPLFPRSDSRARAFRYLRALLQPQTLKALGIDVPDLTRLRADVNRQLAGLRV